jgi:hypothetical protein
MLAYIGITIFLIGLLMKPLPGTFATVVCVSGALCLILSAASMNKIGVGVFCGVVFYLIADRTM